MNSPLLDNVSQRATDVLDTEKALGSSEEAARLYLQEIKREALRVLGLMDREVLSPTFGCLDRTYWAWKFTDFPGARFQEGLCVLSFLYATPLEGNRYYQHPELLKWIGGGFDFWTRIQHRSGDFDEAYPFERSLAATAFTSFHLAEASNFLGGQLPKDTTDRFRRALERGGDWLIRNDEKHGFLSNHLAAAGAALYHTYQITGEERFENGSRYFIGKVLDHQSDEGWYEEYGGADPGYQTHGSFYLARYCELSNDPRLLDSLERSFAFLSHFIHPDGSLGGEYASRNTQTYYPAAFEMMSATSGTAHWIAATMLSSVKCLSAAGLGSVDSYNFFPLLNNYVFAYLACLKQTHRVAAIQPPFDKAGMIHFPEAGLLKVRAQRYDIYIGLTKGGVLKAFDRHKHRLILNDCGYIGRLKNGRLLSSQWLDRNRQINICGNEIDIEGSFYEIQKPVFRPFSFVGFRLFSLTIGRNRWISYWLKSILVKVLIYRKRNLDLHMKRRISLDQEKFTVQDEIHGSIGNRIEILTRNDVFTTIHMGSSRYFLPNELTAEMIATGEGESSVDPTQLERGVTLERTVLVK